MQITRDSLKQLAAALTELTILEREVIVLTYNNSMPASDIAEQLNIAETVVENIRFNALKKLKPKIEQICPD